MADTAPQPVDNPPSPANEAGEQRVLRVVPDPVPDPVPAPRRDPAARVRRNAVLGYAVGCLATVVAVAGGCTLGGLDVWTALGLGAFTGLFGGGAFGFMMASAVSFVRHVDGES